jgi:hypothetical protein
MSRRPEVALVVDLATLPAPRRLGILQVIWTNDSSYAKLWMKLRRLIFILRLPRKQLSGYREQIVRAPSPAASNLKLTGPGE